MVQGNIVLLGIRTLLYYGLMVWATEYMEFGLYSVLMRFSGFSTWDSGSFYNKAANEGAPSSALHPATTALTVISWLWGGVAGTFWTCLGLFILQFPFQRFKNGTLGYVQQAFLTQMLYQKAALSFLPDFS